MVRQEQPYREAQSSMSHTVRKFLSIFLVLGVLAIGGLAQAQAAEHAGHHAQHQAATHGTVLCSWMCAAGTILDTEAVLVQSEPRPIAVVFHTHSNRIGAEHPYITPSRAPPDLPA